MWHAKPDPQERWQPHKDSSQITLYWSRLVEGRAEGEGPRAGRDSCLYILLGNGSRSHRLKRLRLSVGATGLARERAGALECSRQAGVCPNKVNKKEEVRHLVMASCGRPPTFPPFYYNMTRAILVVLLPFRPPPHDVWTNRRMPAIDNTPSPMQWNLYFVPGRCKGCAIEISHMPSLVQWGNVISPGGAKAMWRGPNCS